MFKKITPTVITIVLYLLTILPVQAREKEQQTADRRQEKEEKRALYQQNSNFLRVSPLTALDIGVGFGASYERILGQEKVIGLILPTYLILENNGYSSGRINSYIYFNPGIKVYPFGQRKVTYAIGPNLMLGYGGGRHDVLDMNTGTYLNNGKITRLRIGMLVNNYVNFNITPSFNLGVEAGLGVRYLDRQTIHNETLNTSTTYYNGLEVTGIFSMTLGFRF